MSQVWSLVRAILGDKYTKDLGNSRRKSLPSLWNNSMVEVLEVGQKF
jgi:hypothetical protein